MTNPFAHDRTSNAAGDFVVSATDTASHPLSEEDYRFPPGQMTAPPRAGYYPNGYAP
jgi:hypothetical protein